MSEPSAAGRWKSALVLVAAGAALLLGTLLTAAPAGGGGTGRAGSSYATAPDGAKAAYLLLGRLGHRTERRAEPMGDLRKARLAFLLAPRSRLGGVDLHGVGEWIEGGGTLVYGPATFEPDAELLRQGLELPELELAAHRETEVALVGDWAPAGKLALRASVRTAGRRGRAVAELARHEKATWALQVQRGKGRIYIVDASAFSNRGLKAADNALFLAALAARHAGGGPILFEEFVHGYGDAVSVLSLAAGPLRLAGITALLALLIYALAVGRRLGPPSPEPAAPRRASIEQIEALAAFYAARKDRQSALFDLAAWVGKPAPPAPGRDAAFVVAARALVGGLRIPQRPAGATASGTEPGAPGRSTSPWA